MSVLHGKVADDDFDHVAAALAHAAENDGVRGMLVGLSVLAALASSMEGDQWKAIYQKLFECADLALRGSA